MDWILFIILLPIILGIIGGIVLSISSSKEEQKRLDKLQQNIQQTKDMMNSKGYCATKTIDKLVIDEKNRVWAASGLPYIFKWSDIIEVSYNENGAKQVISGNAGKALIGGAIAGIEGSIIGNSMSRNIVTQVSNISIDIIVNNQEHPFISFPLYSGTPIGTDSIKYQSILSLKNQFIAQLKYMQAQKTIDLDQSEQSLSQQATKNNSVIEYSKTTDLVNNYIVLDIQTMGLDYEKDKILEIAAIKYIDDTEQEKFHTYVNPHKVIPKEVTDINNITNAQTRTSPDIKVALKQFITFIGDYTLIAYKSDFDMSFLQYNCSKNLQHTLENNVIDVLPLAQRYLKDWSNYKLITIQKYFEINNIFGNSLDNCLVTNHLYQYCLKFEKERYIYSIPFSNQITELTQKEIEYVDVISKILKKNLSDIKDVTMDKTDKYLLIHSENSNNINIKLKLYGDEQYILFDIPFDQFQKRTQTKMKYTAGGYDEKGATRLFVESPRQLWDFEKCIVKKKQRNWSTS